MSDNENDLSGRVSLDITDFKTNVSELNRQIKVIDSGFKAAAAGMGDWGASTEGLQSRINSLSGVMDLQRQKIEALNNEYKKVASEKGEDSKAAQDLQIRINKETEALNKNQVELQNATTKLNNFGKEEETAAEKAKRLEKAHKDLDSALSNVKKSAGNVVKSIAGVAAGFAGAATAVFGFTMKAADNADEIQKLSDQTGLTAERVQELTYAGKNLGVEFDTIAGAQSKLIKSMASAQKGTGDQAKAFKTLKIDAVDPATGALRDSNTVFQEVITKLGSVKNETERNVLSMAIFGKSAMELNPLIKAGGSELKKLSDEANKTGAVMSGKTVSALDSFGDTVDGIKQSIMGLAGNLASQLLPALQPLADKIKNIDTKPIVDGFKWLIANAGNIAAAAAGIGAGMVAWNVASMINGVVKAVKAFQLANQGATVAQAALNLVMNANPVGIIITVIAALVAAIIVLWKTNDGFRTALTNTWNAIKQTIVTVVKSIIDFVKNNWKELLTFLVNPVAGALALLYKLNPKFKAWVDGVFNTIVNTLKALPGKMLEIGRNIVTGIWDGIKSMIQWLKDKVGGFASGVVNNIKNKLGIHSPSTVMRDQVGKMMGLGMVEGINDSVTKINAAMSGLNAQVVANPTFNMTPKPSQQAAVVYVNVPVNLDGKTITKSTGRIQYGRNNTKARSLGVIPV